MAASPARRAALTRFWRSVAEAGAASPIRRGPLSVLTGDWSLDRSPGYLAADLLSRVASPYDLNPGGFNPLRALLESQIDFDTVRGCGSVALHIATTCVETGRPEIFSNDRVDADVVLASACLPTLFHAVKIGERHFWDGGFSGNPPLHPFFASSPTEDIVIVQINPVIRPGVPTSARARSANRVNEITFNNSAAGKELRSPSYFVKRLLGQRAALGGLPSYRRMRIHVHVIECAGRS